MAGVLRSPGFDAKVGLLSRIEWTVINRLVVLDDCVSADGDAPLTVLPAASGFRLLLNSRVLITGAFMSSQDVIDAGHRPDDRGDPTGVTAYECGTSESPGWRLFNCRLDEPTLIG